MILCIFYEAAREGGRICGFGAGMRLKILRKNIFKKLFYFNNLTDFFDYLSNIPLRVFWGRAIQLPFKRIYDLFLLHGFRT